MAHRRFELLETVAMPSLLSRLMILTMCDGTMRKSTGRQPEEFTPFGETGLTLASRCGDGPDPRLVELVRILARRAARRWYAQQLEVQRQAKEADSPPV